MRRIVPAAGVLAAVAGLLVMVSGVVPIRASSGHWAVTEWLLHFAMRRSVVTHSLGLDAPPLDDPNLALKGAAHYELTCRPCHGSPDRRASAVVRGMTPMPPELARQVATWRPEHLFYIVKHGVKFTGMPAWPTQRRDDEVWAMVAFLRALPTLDAEGYRRLAHGDPAPRPATASPAPVASDSCTRCHGADGRGRGGAFPALAGQRPAYLLAALHAYGREDRPSGIMQPIAAGLAVGDRRRLAEYYASLSPPARPSAPGADAPAAARGNVTAHQGIRAQRVPSCADCHGPGATRRNPRYPILAGQHAGYLVLQLELFADGRRGGSGYAHLMRAVASRLTAEQMRDVAAYYASLAPDAPHR